MGRRAKNKQGNPESLQELLVHASPKKRKAHAVTEQKRPAKKVKDSAKLVNKHTKLADSSEQKSSGGWEDVPDDDTLPIQTRCVVPCAREQPHLSQTFAL
jgi:hypothetical protein